MKNKVLFKRILCVLLAMTITGASFAMAFGQKEVKNSVEQTSVEVSETSTNKDIKEKSGIKKEETVYVNLDPNGNIYSQIVSSRLHSEDKNIVVKDRSDLDNIIPIKGGSLKENKKGELVWSIDENDIYYHGTTEKKMPMSVDIKYSLNGKEYKPEKLVGKNGKLRIEISVKNNQTNMVNICGKPTKIYSPLVVMIGAVLKDDVFSNVDVDEGSVSVDGSNFVVSMTAMPGLNETLNMKNMSIDELKDIDFKDRFVITADVKDFEMGPIAVVASTEFPDVDTDGTTLDEMKVDLVDLKNMQNDLENMDGDHEIRSLFTDTKKSDAARLLVDDIFELYDLNRTILDILPKYVTHDNVKNLEHFIDDIELVDLDELEDSEVLDYLEELLVKNDNPLNFDELKKIFEVSKPLYGAINTLANDSNVSAFVVAMKELKGKIDVCPGPIKKQFEMILTNKTALTTFINGGVAAVKGGTKGKTSLDEVDLSKATDTNAKTKDKDADTKPATDTDITVNPPVDADTTVNPPVDADTTVNPPADSTESKEKNKADSKTDITETSPAQESTDPKVDSSTKEEKPESDDKKSANDKTTGNTDNKELKAEPNTGDKVLSAVTLDGDSATKADPMSDIIGEISESIVKATKAYNKIYEDKDNAKAIKLLTSGETKVKVEYMTKYFKENKNNIDLMIKIFDATDSRQAKRIARTASHLRDTIHDMKPQLFNLQKDIKKPGMRESLRESPEMIRTLVKMNGDLNDNRNISDILKRAVSEENSKTFKSMIETLDRLIEEDAIGRYLENVDDIKELLERKDALVELSNNQPAYSGASDDADTSVRFIMKTDEIKKPEVKKEQTVKEEPKGKIRSFFEKIFN